jgi:hypothetical protein
MMEAIRRLSEDPRNVVVVITGLTRLKLGDTFAGLNNVTLATSTGLVYSWGDNLKVTHKCHSLDTSCTNTGGKQSEDCGREVFTLSSQVSGCGHDVDPVQGTMSFLSYFYRVIYTFESVSAALAKNGDDDREWECMECNVNWTAVAATAVPIITRFTFRTNGTCQTPRFPGIGWSYFGADPEWGQKQASQLTVRLLFLICLQLDGPYHCCSCYIVGTGSCACKPRCEGV